MLIMIMNLMMIVIINFISIIIIMGTWGRAAMTHDHDLMTSLLLLMQNIILKTLRVSKTLFALLALPALRACSLTCLMFVLLSFDGV